MRTKLLFLTSAALALSSAEACTGLKLIAKDGSTVHGRTLEFGRSFNISIAVVPRGYSFTGTHPQGAGLHFQSKYAVVGAISFDEPSILDGINEKGLSVGTFYFPGFAEYTTGTKENQSIALSPTEFPNWIITQFATLEEVKAALPSIAVTPTPIKSWDNTTPPLHYIVYDREGNSLVIEPIGGTLKVFENPLGVITNSPTFDWHMIHLRNHLHLTPLNIPTVVLEGVALSPLGHGTGMVGMPGDFTPPSRFVRAAIYAQAALPAENAAESIFQLFHVLNQFDIPKGAIRDNSTGNPVYDYTLFTSARDPKSLKFYYKSYEDQTIKVVDLNRFDLNAKSIKKISTSGKETIVDVSTQLKENSQF